MKWTFWGYKNYWLNMRYVCSRLFKNFSSLKKYLTSIHCTSKTKLPQVTPQTSSINFQPNSLLGSPILGDQKYGSYYSWTRSCWDVSSGIDWHPDRTEIYFNCSYRVIESSSLVPLLFREVFSHPYISFFHLLVNGFCVTSFRTFFS